MVAEAASIPPEVLLPNEVEEAQIIQQWLRTRRGGEKVEISVPHAGISQELVQMATENQVILAYGVYQNRSDVHLLQPMIEVIEVNMGTKPAEITADKGYCSQSNYEYVTKQEIVAAIPPQTYDFDMAARHQGTYQYSNNLVYEK